MRPVTGVVLMMLLAAASSVFAQNDPVVQVETVTISPSRIIAGQQGTGTVTLNHPAYEPTNVSLGISSPFATIPPRVTIPAGQTSATFTVSVIKDGGYTPVNTYEGIIYANYNVTVEGKVAILSTIPPTCDGGNADYCTNAICYSCVLNEPDVDAGLIPFYQKEKNTNKDPFVVGDSRFVIWRSSGKADCSVLDTYRAIAAKEEKLGKIGNYDRLLAAYAVIAFTEKECGINPSASYERASRAAKGAGRLMESSALEQLAAGTYKPEFGDVNIVTSITVPPGATTITLGNSFIDVMRGTHVGTQVDRVGRDWISMEIPWWNLSHNNFNPEDIVPWGEGVQVGIIAAEVPDAKINPLTGTLIARYQGRWYAPDEKGVFRFIVLDDKVQYPTTHVDGDFGWVEDTHGISALVSQSLEFKDTLVIGCGDAVGKAKGAYYLASKGVDVMMPPDRYESLLLGYTGTKGTLIGTAPIREISGGVVIGAQPITFSLAETFIIEDTDKPYPLQYYDAPARYFHRLTHFVPLAVVYVKVDGENQLPKLFAAAEKANARTVGVRISTDVEDEQLIHWLQADPNHRAILFHSSLFPYAEQIFHDYPDQVTFGDLHPIFGTGEQQAADPSSFGKAAQ